uniref:Nonstructural protein n=1 Tax=Parvoviridae sp. TaxID=1940570 RepID=A0A893A8F7_9VIRU|nr:MAG: nonstructural protein [Parvoviridae sp.]
MDARLINLIDQVQNGDIEDLFRMDNSGGISSTPDESYQDLESLLASIDPVPGSTEVQAGPIPRSSTDVRTIARSDYVHERELFTPEFRSLLARTFRYTSGSSGRYISDVFQCETQTEAEKFCRDVRNDALGNYRGGFLIVVRDGTHVHVVHVCTFTSGWCRCSFIQKAKGRAELRRPINQHRRKYAKHLTEEDLSRIFFYFAQKGRGSENLYSICGRVEEIPSENIYLPGGQDQMDARREELKSLEGVNYLPDVELLTSDEIRHTNEQINRARSERAIVKRKGGKAELQKRIIELCQLYPCSPLIAVLNHREWLLDPQVQFMRNDNKLVQSVMDNWSHIINNWKLDNFISLYNDPKCKPYFEAPTDEIFNYYYTVEESLKILEDFLSFQFNGNELAIYDFLMDVHDICERVIPKCNTLVVYSPPSAGKNFFFDMILAFYLNKGQMGNPNKHNSFAFQECFNKRILLWNEPNYESNQIEKLKMILGGDNYTVNVKCKADAPVHRTPVICLTNNKVPFMNDPAFKDRIIQYQWRPCIMLKECKKKPYPVTYYHLLKQYSIIKYTIFYSSLISSISSRRRTTNSFIL